MWPHGMGKAAAGKPGWTGTGECVRVWGGGGGGGGGGVTSAASPSSFVVGSLDISSGLKPHATERCLFTTAAHKVRASVLHCIDVNR